MPDYDELKPGAETDRNVEAVIEMHRQRAAKGLSKYGVTTERGDLSFIDWLTHLQEELMDAAVYIERVKREADRPAKTDDLMDCGHSIWSLENTGATPVCRECEAAKVPEWAVKAGCEIRNEACRLHEIDYVISAETATAIIAAHAPDMAEVREVLREAKKLYELGDDAAILEEHNDFRGREEAWKTAQQIHARIDSLLARLENRP